MVRYILQQIKIQSSRAYGKWFAKNVVEETIDLDALSEHMSTHNSPYSKGVIKGLLTDMISCIKELLLEGKNVKIDDLAIFSLGIKNKAAANSEEDFTVAKNIEGVKLRARATGELMSKTLNLEATLKKASYINGKLTTEGANGGSLTPNENSLTPDPSPQGEGSQNGNSNSGNSGSQTPSVPTLTISRSGSGTSSVTIGGNAVSSGAEIAQGTEVAISVTPAEGQTPTAMLNGSSITLTESEGTYTGTFQMPDGNATLVINSGGSSGGGVDQN